MPVDMKNVIASTFAAMAKQKGIDKITVKALIDACGISRQTFYYHFQDIMEVVEWSLEQVTQDAVERSLQAESPEKAIGTLISLAMENRTLIRRLLDSQRREQIEKLFVQATRTYLQALIRNRTRKLPVRYEDMEVALDFWAFAEYPACCSSAASTSRWTRTSWRHRSAGCCRKKVKKTQNDAPKPGASFFV